MFEDAVALALTFDGELAASIARQPEGDDALSRKLWLAIAKHLIEQSAADGGPPKVRPWGLRCVVHGAASHLVFHRAAVPAALPCPSLALPSCWRLRHEV